MSKPLARPTRLFLDANVLISAARKDGSKVLRLWRLPNVELITSEYVLIECRRNLPTPDQQERFAGLMRSVRLAEFSTTTEFQELPAVMNQLPEKDRPVLTDAIFAHADFLITGDKRHFGQWYGVSLLGIGIEPPSEIIDLLDPDHRSFTS
jgi:predicted nucleic acid-binding protein